MGFGSVWHWVIVLLIVLVLFGRGRVAEIMGDFGKGIKSFKKGLNEDEAPAHPAEPAARIEGPSHEAKPASEAAADPRPAADKNAG